MDRYDVDKRSYVMAQIRKTNTKLEKNLASLLQGVGVTSYLRYPRDLPGSPDFVFVPERLVVFLDSCFWHGCPKHLRMPKSNLAYWQGKIETNRKRDRRQTKQLEEKGWRVLRIWEHELKTPESMIRKVRRALSR